MGEPTPSNRPAPQRYRVHALEPDERLRTRMTLELAGIATAPVQSLDEIAGNLAMGEPTVVLFGASLANDGGVRGRPAVDAFVPGGGRRTCSPRS